MIGIERMGYCLGTCDRWELPFFFLPTVIGELIGIGIGTGTQRGSVAFSLSRLSCLHRLNRTDGRIGDEWWMGGRVVWLHSLTTKQGGVEMEGGNPRFCLLFVRGMDQEKRGIGRDKGIKPRKPDGMDSCGHHSLSGRN